jgi:prepilin-type N-terminal cleavage/methylation domain-containing protein/prepilin-type processing-associated H-X9-DG protein
MKRKKAFTLVELLVVISVIALLLSILVPSLRKARALAEKAACGSNIKQIALALGTYAMNNKGNYPAGYYHGRDIQGNLRDMQLGVDSFLLVSKHLESEEVFQCPSDKFNLGLMPHSYVPSPYLMMQIKERTRENRLSYAWNIWEPSWPDGYMGWKAEGQIHSPSRTILQSEVHHLWNVLYARQSNNCYFGPMPPNQETGTGYGYLEFPGNAMWIFDRRNASSVTTDPGHASKITWPHETGVNFGFADGHMEFMKIDVVKEWPPMDYFDGGIFKGANYLEVGPLGSRSQSR